jgi:hypothetical protein
MINEIKIPSIPDEEITPTVHVLLNTISQCVEMIRELREENRQLKDEIVRMKGGNPKPKIRPSNLEKDLTKNGSRRKTKRRKQNKKPVEIEETIKVSPEAIPEGSRFKGYKTYRVHDISIQAQTKRYRREYWKTPDGKWIIAPLPPGVDGHYGASLRQYIMHLNYEMNVPQHVILESIKELGIPISAGELSDILTKRHDRFHDEKERILDAGIRLFPYVSVDDTGTRHQGKNGYCTHIGNEFFSYFKSTSSKSRINFLKILRGKKTDYRLIDESFLYMETQGLSKAKHDRLRGAKDRMLSTDIEWEEFLKMTGIRAEKDIKIVTEAALMGSIQWHGINKDLVIVSDDAGQFNILMHALCWLHAERKLAVLLPINDYEAKIIDEIRTAIWNFYNELKAYKQSPGEGKIQLLEEQFDAIFMQTTEFETINKSLRLIHENKQGLLMVLKRPEIPLHNNESENAIRVYVTKRKVQGGTRSEDGRQCRDTFVSLIKTCRKLKISFRDYLMDRMMGGSTIKSLDFLMRQAFLARSPVG